MQIVIQGFVLHPRVQAVACLGRELADTLAEEPQRPTNLREALGLTVKTKPSAQDSRLAWLETRQKVVDLLAHGSRPVDGMGRGQGPGWDAERARPVPDPRAMTDLPWPEREGSTDWGDRDTVSGVWTVCT